MDLRRWRASSPCVRIRISRAFDSGSGVNPPMPSPRPARKRDATSELIRGSALLRPVEVRPAWTPFDRRLPHGGLEAGTIVDLLAEEGAGGLALALRLAAGLLARAPRRAAILVDLQGELYPPALAQAGLDLARVVLLRPRSAAEAAACLDKALRSPAVAAAVARVAGLSGAACHRLRLAARAGGGVGLLVRPPAEAGQVSGAALRLEVARACPVADAGDGDDDARRPGAPVDVRPLRLRGGAPDDASWRLDLDAPPDLDRRAS